MLMLFLYIGMEDDYAGWISSYATLSGVSSKEQATIFPMLFWGLMTASRFGCSAIPGSNYQKLTLALKATAVSAIFTIVLIHDGWGLIACYFSAVLMGITMATLYPLIFSMASDFGWRLNEHQTNNIYAGGVIGEGILTMFVGELMKWVSSKVLFLSHIILALVVLMLSRVAVKVLDRPGQMLPNCEETPQSAKEDKYSELEEAF